MTRCRGRSAVGRPRMAIAQRAPGAVPLDDLDCQRSARRRAVRGSALSARARAASAEARTSSRRARAPAGAFVGRAGEVGGRDAAPDAGGAAGVAAAVGVEDRARRASANATTRRPSAATAAAATAPSATCASRAGSYSWQCVVEQRSKPSSACRPRFERRVGPRDRPPAPRASARPTRVVAGCRGGPRDSAAAARSPRAATSRTTSAAPSRTCTRTRLRRRRARQSPRRSSHAEAAAAQPADASGGTDRPAHPAKHRADREQLTARLTPSVYRSFSVVHLAHMARILVIDDDQGVRDSMARMLRGAGYTVRDGNQRAKRVSSCAPRQRLRRHPLGHADAGPVRHRRAAAAARRPRRLRRSSS